MNALSILRDIEEAFFRCSVCLNSLPSPMMLSCCHPYCKECLEAVIEASETALICPVCGTNCDIPDNGMDGFGPEQRVEYTYQSIQIQKSLMREELGKCAGCEVEKILVSYCYYCKCFLCSECYEMHLTSKMFYDHRPHIINLKNISAVKATLEKLVILSEGHRCAKHRHIDQSMCHGCGKEPVCSHTTARKIIESKTAAREAKQEEHHHHHHHHDTAPKSVKSGRKSRHKTDRTQPESQQSDDKEDESMLTIDEKIDKRRKELEDLSREEAAKLYELRKKEAQDKHDEIERELAAKTEELMTNGDRDGDSRSADQGELIYKQVDIGP